MSSVTIRPATPADVPALLQFIRELAAYERLEHEVVATEAAIGGALFGARPVAEAAIAEAGGEPAGYALFFPNFSTFLGKPGLYLEDLYVRPAFRGRGIGRMLLRHLAGLAIARGWGRMDWTVLAWNTPAIGFYERLGAHILPDWRTCRVTGRALEELARE